MNKNMLGIGYDKNMAKKVFGVLENFAHFKNKYNEYELTESNLQNALRSSRYDSPQLF